MLLSSYQQLPVWRLDPVGCWRNTHNFFECLSWVCVCDSQWRKVLVFQCWTRRTSWVCVCVRVIIFTPSKGVAVMCSAWLCWRIPHSWMMHSKLLFLIITNFDLRVRMDGKRWKSGLLEMIQFMSLGNWAGVQFFLPTTYLAQSPVSTCCLLFVCVDWLGREEIHPQNVLGGEERFHRKMLLYKTHAQLVLIKRNKRLSRDSRTRLHYIRHFSERWGSHFFSLG